MNVTIDRFEGDYAIVELEAGEFAHIPKILLPGATEGDIVLITINQDETKKRKESIRKLMDDLWID